MAELQTDESAGPANQGGAPAPNRLWRALGVARVEVENEHLFAAADDEFARSGGRRDAGGSGHPAEKRECGQQDRADEGHGLLRNAQRSRIGPPRFTARFMR